MFRTKLKTKKYRNSKERNLPFPIVQRQDGSEMKFVGTFTGFSVDIIDKENSELLFENGCYGKGSKSRSTPYTIKNSTENAEMQEVDYDENLVLDLEESFFLFHMLKVLTIIDLNGKEIPTKVLLDKILIIKSNFLQTLVGYIYLKSKNWIVKSGMKFGGDFLLYKKSMRHYHASFVVLISDGTPQTAKDTQGIQRIAETSDKDVLFLEINPPSDIQVTHPEEYLLHLNKFSIAEVVIRRFDFKQFVQNK